MQRRILLLAAVSLTVLMFLPLLFGPAESYTSPAPALTQETSEEKAEAAGAKTPFPHRFPLASEVAPELFEKYKPGFKIDPSLLEDLEDPSTVSLKAIIQFRPGTDILMLLPPGIKVRHDFWGLIPFIAVEMPADRALIESLANTEGIVAIYKDAENSAKHLFAVDQLDAPSGVAGLPRLESPWMYLMNETLSKIGVPDVWARDYIGMGVVVALLDTGIAKDFPNFYFPEDFPDPDWRLKNKVIDEVSFVPGEGPYDTNGHGTAVAHVIASTGRTGGRVRYYDYDKASYDYAYVSPDAAKGVAPGCFLMNVKCISSEGSFEDSWVMAALVYALYHGADVIACSWGYDWLDTIVNWEAHYPVFYTVEWCVQNGAVVVFPAGNEGPGYGTIMTPGNLEAVITVGSTSEYDTVSPWSSRGPTTGRGARGLPFPNPGPAGALRMKPDLVAPGEMVVTAYYKWRDGDYSFWALSGTSLAYAHVAGAVALLLDAFPGLRPASVKIGLMQGADKLVDPYTGEYYDYNAMGAGRLNVYNAYEYLSEEVPRGKDSSIGAPTLTREPKEPSWRYWTPYFDNVTILVEDRITDLGRFSNYFRELRDRGVQLDYASSVLPRPAMGFVRDVPYYVYRSGYASGWLYIYAPPEAEMFALHFPVVYLWGYGYMYIYDENFEVKQLIYRAYRPTYTREWHDIWSTSVEGDMMYVYYYLYYNAYFEIDKYTWARELGEMDIPPVESPHPYNPNMDEWYVIDVPGAEAFSIHFDRICIERFWDTLYIYDEDFNLVTFYYNYYYGSYYELRDVWTPLIYGSRAYLRLCSDFSVQYWGFKADKVRIYAPPSPGKIYTTPITIESDHPYTDPFYDWVLESPHPYEEGWNTTASIYTGGLPLCLFFENVTLEEGDTLLVKDNVTGTTMTIADNMTDFYLDYWFQPNATGYVIINFTFVGDHDTHTAWGFKTKGYSLQGEIIWGPYRFHEEDRYLVRLHFSRINLDCGDMIHVYNATHEWWFGGNETDLWTPWFEGEDLWIELVSTDCDDRSFYGFTIDMYEATYWRTSKDLLKHYSGYYILNPSYETETTEEALVPPVESPHPYPNNAYLTYEVKVPGAVRIRVFFERISVEYGFDYLYLYDDYGNSQEFTGYYYDVWSRWFEGDTVHIVLTSDYIVTDWGFRATAVEYEKSTAVVEEDISLTGSATGWYSVEKPGALNLAVYFTNITLASGDYLEVYDEEMNLLANYTTSTTDVWTPEGGGDILYIHLVSVSGSAFFNATRLKARITYYEDIISVEDIMGYIEEYGGHVLITGEDLKMIPTIDYYGTPFGYNYYTTDFGITWKDVAMGGPSTNIKMHPITRGVDVLYFGLPRCSLVVDETLAEAIAYDPHFPGVAVYENDIGGALVAIADDDVLDDDYLYRAKNLRLGLNIMAWFGGWDTGVFDVLKVLARHAVGFGATYPLWVYNNTDFTIGVKAANFGNYTENVMFILEAPDDRTLVAPGRISRDVEVISPTPTDVVFARMTGKVYEYIVESAHPYEVGWAYTFDVDTYGMMRRFHFVNITLEEGDVLYITDLATGYTWYFDENATDVWSPYFPDGVQEIGILDDGDGLTAWGILMDSYETAIESLHPYPETLWNSTWTYESPHPYPEGTTVYNEYDLVPPVESPHPYPSNAWLVYTISHPGALYISVHFDYIEVETWWDFIYIYDEDWNFITYYTGIYSDVWTPWVAGDTIHIVLDSDWWINWWGFIADRYATIEVAAWSDEVSMYTGTPIRLHFNNITLEEGDVLAVSDLVGGGTWYFEENTTDAWTGWILPNETGFVNIRFTIMPDGDGLTGWGFSIDGFKMAVEGADYLITVDDPHAVWTYTFYNPMPGFKVRFHIANLTLDEGDKLIIRDWLAPGVLATEVVYEENITDLWTDWFRGMYQEFVIISDEDGLSAWGLRIDTYELGKTNVIAIQATIEPGEEWEGEFTLRVISGKFINHGNFTIHCYWNVTAEVMPYLPYDWYFYEAETFSGEYGVTAKEQRVGKDPNISMVLPPEVTGYQAPVLAASPGDVKLVNLTLITSVDTTKASMTISGAVADIASFYEVLYDPVTGTFYIFETGDEADMVMEDVSELFNFTWVPEYRWMLAWAVEPVLPNTGHGYAFLAIIIDLDVEPGVYEGTITAYDGAGNTLVEVPVSVKVISPYAGRVLYDDLDIYMVPEGYLTYQPPWPGWEWHPFPRYLWCNYFDFWSAATKRYFDLDSLSIIKAIFQETDFVDNYVEWPPGSGKHISDYPPYERAQKYYEFLDWFFSQYNCIIEPAHYSLYWDNVIFYREIEDAENVVVAYTVERAIRVALEHGAGLLIMAEHGYREWIWQGVPVAYAVDTTVVDRMNSLLELIGADIRVGYTPEPGEWMGDPVWALNVTKEWMVDHPITRGVSHFTMAAWEWAGFMQLVETHTFLFVGSPQPVEQLCYIKVITSRTKVIEETRSPYLDKWYALGWYGPYIRLHFEYIDLYYGDYLDIYDENMNLVVRYSGYSSLTNVWTPWVEGTVVYINYRTSGYSAPGGFKMDLMQRGRMVGKPIESPHPYPPNAHLVYSVEHPGASMIRLHFERWAIEPNYVDAIYIYDENWTLIDWFNPARHGVAGEDAWTEWVPGDKVYVVLTSDAVEIGGDVEWGFRIDAYEYCTVTEAYAVAYAFDPAREVFRPVIAVDDYLPDYPNATVVVIGDHAQFSNYFFSHYIPVRFVYDTTGYVRYCRWDLTDLAEALLAYATGFYKRLVGAAQASLRDQVVEGIELVEAYIDACKALGIPVEDAEEKLNAAKAELEAGDDAIERKGASGCHEAFEHYLNALDYLEEAFDLAVEAAYNTATELKKEYEDTAPSVEDYIDSVAAYGIDVSTASERLSASSSKKDEGDAFLNQYDPENKETAVFLLNATAAYRDALDLLEAARSAAEEAAEAEANDWIARATAMLEEAKRQPYAPADKLEAADAALGEAMAARDEGDYLTAIDKAKEAYDLAKQALEEGKAAEAAARATTTYAAVGAGVAVAAGIGVGAYIWSRRRA